MSYRSNILKRMNLSVDRLFRRLTAVGLESRSAITQERCLPIPYARDIPRDTVKVLDVSGSMRDPDYWPTRLEGGICAAIAYTNARAEQCPNDRIAVVSFNSAAQTVLPLTSIAEKVTIIRAIRGLTPFGGTDIAKGLNAAAKIYDCQELPHRKKYVTVLTDGHGGKPLRIANKLKTKYRAVIDVVGIGGSPRSVNESLLRKVATTDPDGFCHYRFIKDPVTLRKHYEQLAMCLTR